MSASETIDTAYDEPPGWADRLYEVVDGKFVEPTPMGLYEGMVAAVLHDAIIVHFSASGRTGWVVVEMLFRLFTQPKRARRPDLAYVSYDRWPRDRPFSNTAAWEVVPDLAVEVVSPGNTAIEIFVKLDEYFRAGVRRVWVIYPQQGFVQDYEALDRVKVLNAEGILDGGKVLPGFKIKLSDLFNIETSTTD